MEDDIGLKFLEIGSFNTFTMTMATLAVILVVVMLCANVFLRVWGILSGWVQDDGQEARARTHLKKLFLHLEYSLPIPSGEQSPFCKGFLRSLSGHGAFFVTESSPYLVKGQTIHVHLGPYVEHGFHESVSIQGKITWLNRIKGDDSAVMVRVKFDEKEWSKEDLTKLIGALAGMK